MALFTPGQIRPYPGPGLAFSSFDHLATLLGTHLGRRGAGVELHRVELPVHEVEPGVDGPAVDGAQDLLLGRRPLPAPGAQRLVEALE